MRLENEATLRSILRSDAVIIGACMIAIGLQFLVEAPIFTRGLFMALTEVAENEVWGSVLILLGTLRVAAVAAQSVIEAEAGTPMNYRLTLASSIAAGLCAIAWGVMALIFFSKMNGGNLLFVLAIIDTSRSIRMGKIAAAIAGRIRRRGLTAGDS